MKKYGYVILAALIFGAAGRDDIARATMYQCVDASGSVRYTDMRESRNCTPVIFNDRKTSFGQGTAYTGSNLLLDRLAAKYDRYIRYYGVRYNIDPHLIRAIIRCESAFNPKAVSKKGAQGLMQLMPATARELQVADPFDPEANIDGGTRYLRSLLNTFRQDLRLALAAYNAGPTIVRKEQTVPRIPETIEYVKRVLTYYRQYKDGRS